MIATVSRPCSPVESPLAANEYEHSIYKFPNYRAMPVHFNPGESGTKALLARTRCIGKIFTASRSWACSASKCL